ncbi:hypothetical protein PMSD_18435 [Paenibacillus macquariensis subsp. defensor]|nr:hypothetical protein PMSD_18435 [Paenibacillus macquariensis subsp. defensor]
MKGDLLYLCIDKGHRFVVGKENAKDGLRCVVCGSGCYPYGPVGRKIVDGLPRYEAGRVAVVDLQEWESTLKGGMKCRTATPLLTITVQDLDSVPVVTYKGEVIHGKVSISYEWLTREDKGYGRHNARIKHIDKDVGSIEEIAFNKMFEDKTVEGVTNMDKDTELKPENLREFEMLTKAQHIGELMIAAGERISRACIAVEKDLSISAGE